MAPGRGGGEQLNTQGPFSLHAAQRLSSGGEPGLGGNTPVGLEKGALASLAAGSLPLAAAFFFTMLRGKRTEKVRMGCMGLQQTLSKVRSHVNRTRDVKFFFSRPVYL